MAAGQWRAECACGWLSTPSADLAEQTDELDQHLRTVVIAEQRPTRLTRVATGTALQVVDHTLLLAALVVGMVLPLVGRVRRH